MKDVIVGQQGQIEKIEAEKRQLNVIVSGIPESNLKVEGEELTSDSEKMAYLCGKIKDSFDEDDLASCTRLGQQKSGQNRLLRVKFEDLSVRNEIFFNQKMLRETPKGNPVCKVFGMIYFNKDLTPLMRKEEKRLREEMKNMRSSCDSSSKIYIRSGKLYHNSNVVDKIDVARQLF